MKKVYAVIGLLWFGVVATYAQDFHPAELLRNPSFEEEARPIRNRRFGPNGEGELFGSRLPAGVIPGWIMLDNREEKSKMTTISDNLPDTTQRKVLCWEVLEAPAAIANVGFQGIEAIKGGRYTLSFWTRADKRYRGNILVGLQSKSGGTWHAQVKVKGKVKKRWKMYTITFTAHEDDLKARLVMTADKPGTLYFDCVSLTAL